jgi:pimeloyl-ACP methyl ester carboxylesterase
VYRMLAWATLAIAALPSPAMAKPTVPTIEQLAAFPSMSGFSVSPDGKHMAALEARGEDRVILVWDTANLGASPTTIGATQMKVQGVSFVKNDLLAVSLWQPYDARDDTVTKTFAYKLFLTDLAGKQWREPFPLPRARTEAEELDQAVSNPQVLDALPNDPDNILVVNSVGDNAGDVYKVNIHTNRAEKVQRSDEKVNDYITDLEGTIRVRTKIDSDGTGLFVSTQFRNASGGWEEHNRSYVKARDVFRVIGFTGDPNVALVESNVGSDKIGIFTYDVSARKTGEALFKHKFFEANGVTVCRLKNNPGGCKFGEVTALHYAGPRGDDVIYVAPEFKAIDAALRKAFNITSAPQKFIDPATGESATVNYDTGLSFRITSGSFDLKTIVVAVDSTNQPVKYYLLKDGQLSLLSNSYANVDPASIGKTELVYYKARDGLDIPAFLTKPSEALCGAGPWPTVIHPHGGPWARDDLTFDYFMWVPLISSRCMAVLRPQFRGSEGWGRKLWTAGDAEWGQKMQDDKDDGAKWLMEQKIAIPGRIAMFGFSYGGYSAFAAAVRPNGLYKCAIAGAGVSDIKRIWSRFYENEYFRENQAATVKGLNPVEFADKIKIPIMVYHGERDRTVPIEQSDWFVSKARKSGQKVEYTKLADFAHGPAWTRAIDAHQLTLISDYLTKGCGGGGL